MIINKLPASVLSRYKPFILKEVEFTKVRVGSGSCSSSQTAPATATCQIFRKLMFIQYIICLFSALLAASSPPAFSQSPSLKCTEVDSLGNVQITWLPPSDSCGFFNQYYIFYSQVPAGPYVAIDSVSGFFTATYYHSGANANMAPGYYFIQSSSGCPGNTSDTLSTIYLSVSNNPLGVANLSWNNQHNPGVTTNTGWYYILRQDTPGGILVLKDSVFQINSFVDSFTVCNDSIDYQIVSADSSGCINASNIQLLEPDALQPGAVIIDSVSVDTLTGLGTIGWQPGLAADVAGYIIYIANNFGGWDSIFTVYGKDSTFFMDLNSMVDSNSVLYNIVAFDNCGNKGIFGQGHTTIYLSGVLDTCRGEAVLNWNEYLNWQSGVSGYEVFLSVNGGTYSMLGFTASTQFIHTGLVRGDLYCYYVRAYDGTGFKTSTSNLMCTYKDTVSSSGVAFTLAVEPRDSVKNLLNWNEDPFWSILLSSYNIFRSFDGSAYTLVGNVTYGTNSFVDSLQPLWSFIDGKGDFCYFVVPVKSSFNLYGCIDTSNYACVSQFPKFIVPNTFTPNFDGINDVFIPIKVFVDKSDYLFIIYNRWGQKIFETSNSSEGWDGLLKGTPVQNDAYVYYVKFKIKGNMPIEKAGTVILLR